MVKKQAVKMKVYNRPIMLRKLLSFFVLFIFVISFGGCQTKVSQVIVTDYSFVATESGKTALEVTKDHVSVESKQYDFGVMVESINGHRADTTHFWGLYVNDQLAQIGADKLIVYKDDIVGWKYETIK
jgi:hypothetical protein